MHGYIPEMKMLKPYFLKFCDWGINITSALTDDTNAINA